MALLAVTPIASGGTDDKIVGGSPANPGEYPAQGLLVVDTNGDGTAEEFCGGTLVGAIWFLTAAHCVTSPQGFPYSYGDVSVMLGDHDLTPPNVFLPLRGLERHAGYNVTTQQNDLAMLRLQNPAPQQPLRVIRPDEAARWAPGTPGRIVGWGSTSEGGPPSTVLLEATVPIRADNDCGLYGNSFDPETMVCAAPHGGGTDSCQGDSGGPLMVDDGSGALVLAGVTSWGFGCAQADYPGVYVRLGAPALNQWVMDRHSRASFTSSGLHSGQAATFTASSFFPLGGTATYAWDFDADGLFDDAHGPSASWTFPRGTHSVGLEASESARSRDRPVSRQTIVVNGSPTAVASNGRAYSLREGSAVRLRGSGTDPEGQALSFAWDFDGDEIYETPGPSPVFSAARLDGPLEPFVTLRVCDASGGCTTDTTLVRISNVPPRANAGRDRSVRRRTRLRLRIRATDPGMRDRLRIRWTCGNRSRGSGRTVTCRYRRAGRYVIRITVTDGDGGVGRDSVRVRVRR
jgi:hypothetical protein